jgi:protein O-mannosyl-transferase
MTKGVFASIMQGMAEKVNNLFKHRNFNLIAFFVLAIVTLVAYSNTFHASFHFDDNPSIVDNYTIKVVTVDNIMAILKGVRPVVYLSLMLNYSVGGMNVVGYHVFNVAVHIANAFLVFLLISGTLALPVFSERYTVASGRRIALFAALLFAVHPVQTEAVTYIISRTELLATFFYLAALLMFMKAVLKRKPIYHLGLFLSALLSMSSKEWAVTLPAMLMLYDYLFLSNRSVKTVLSHGMSFVLAALPWAVVLSNLNLFSNPSVGFNMSSVTTTVIVKSPLTYLLTSFNVLWTYIRLLFVPINQNLDYEYPIAKTLFEFPTLLSFLGHVAVVAAAFWLFKKRGWTLIPFGIAWFYITISPTQSFVPVMDIIFEHRVYMPSIGFFLAFVVAYDGLFEWWEKRRELKKRTVMQQARTA